MFGYVRPCRPELKIKDDAFFKSYYCGVCKALGRRSGPLCRGLLRYDLAFLCLVRDGVLEDSALCTLRCPIKGNKLNMMQGDSVSFCADAHILLSAAKLRDDRRDGQRASLLLTPVLSPAEKKVAAAYPELHGALDEMLRAQDRLEEAGCAEPDDAAEPFSRFLAQLFAFGMPEKSQPSLRFMGYNIGKWIYWLDALDDYDRDEKRGAYNCWRAAGYDRKAACQWVLPLLMQCISQAQLCCDLLETSKTDVLIQNILGEGMPRVMEAVAEGRRLDDGSI